MVNLVFCVIAIFAFLQTSTATEKVQDVEKPVPVPVPLLSPTSSDDKKLQPAETLAANVKDVKPAVQKLQMMLISVDVAKNLWREDEKGEMFQVLKVPESGQLPVLVLDKNESTPVTSPSPPPTPHHSGDLPCPLHVQDILIPKGVEKEHASQIPDHLGVVAGPQPVRRYIKQRTSRTFWPFVSWGYWDDPCYYGGPGCYPEPPYPDPYYPPPPPPYY